MNPVQSQTSPDVEYRSLEKVPEGPDSKVQTATEGIFSRIGQSVKDGLKKCFRRYESKVEQILLEKAITGTDEEFVLKLVKDKKIKGGKLLLKAANVGHSELVRILLKKTKEVDCNARNKEGQTPLIVAALKGHTEVARALLERDDIDTDARDNGGCSALTYATMYGREEILDMLLKDDPDPAMQREARWEEMDQSRQEQKETAPMIERKEAKEDQYL